jgi:cellulose synthase/poly-beta-1,6-N-acetylglucosamine synthase-like glycosyltransferase
MITVGITTYNEEKSIGKVIDLWLKQSYPEDYEIIVVAGGEDKTKNIVSNYAKKYRRVKAILEKESKGKPAALNKLFNKAKGRIIILTDGDVFPGKNVVKPLIRHFEDKYIGAVSGRPVPLNKKDNMFGWWQWFLCDIADKKRREAKRKGVFYFASGYLYAIRAGLVKKIRADALSDDGVVSHLIKEKGYKIGYAPEASIYVKYPQNFKDWIKQKKRTIAGFHQINEWFPGEQSRSFFKESSGFFSGLRYCKKPKEFLYFFALCFARLYVWISSFFEVRRKDIREIWKPVRSTK